MEKVKPLTFIAPIKEGDLEKLRKKLADINDNQRNNRFLSFAKLPSIHFARLVILDKQNAKDRHHYPHQLLIATNFNGSLENHVKELTEAGEFYQVLDHCIGYQRDSTLKYIKKHSNYRAYFFASTWGRTAGQVKQEDKNTKLIEKIADTFRSIRFQPEGTFSEIKKELLNTKDYKTIKSAGRLPTVWKPILLTLIVCAIGFYGLIRLTGIVLFSKIFIISVLVLFALLGVAVWYLRKLEKNDEEYNEYWASSESTAEFTINEDMGVQNQFTSVVEIKDGIFRKTLLKVVLGIIGFTTHFMFNKGKLGSIPTIHFARWVIIDKGRRLLFLSNFDGSWENYLGDFVDKGAVGLTAIWSNTKLFPRSKFLVFDGATDEERFKAVARLNQVSTNVWYSAYPELSVMDKNRNTLIGKGFNGEIKAKAFPQWLRDTLNISPPPKINRANMQGLLLDSYARLRVAKYIFIEITELSHFQKWLEIAKFDSAQYRTNRQAINIAFSNRGLERMGIKVNGQNGFSRAFIEGMDTPHRNRVLGDLCDNDPDNWRWGNKEDKKLHALLLLYAKNEDILGGVVEQLKDRSEEYGFAFIHEPIEGKFEKDFKEHFGFSDGISQPAMKGISSRTFFNDVIELGEFIFGYRNQYGKFPNRPEPVIQDNTLSAFGDDGSYMVFRQLKQNVGAFWKNMLELSDTTERNIAPAIELASKLIGRRPNGDALAAMKVNPKDTIDKKNEFNYKDSDGYGIKCPYGSHIRRTNPRDSLSISTKKNDKEYAINIVKNHRILRRGRSYGPAVAESMEIDDIISKLHNSEAQERGLNFICFNSNIERQFEFIQGTWVNNIKFHDLYDEVDPLIGVKKDKESQCPFSVQGRPMRKRYSNLEQFVEVVGGSYLFFPSISAIAQLSNLRANSGHI